MWCSKYKTLHAFISGATVKNNLKEEIQESGSLGEDTSDNDSAYESILEEQEWVALGFSSDFNRGSIPIMQGVANKIFREKHITLDKIQYIAYEVICSSFVINLIQESSESQSPTALGFAESEEDLRNHRTTLSREKIKQKLKELGAKEQLLMFVTGPAGAGNSTAIDVAQQFCFQFCKSMDILWGETFFSLPSLDVLLPCFEE